jgi:hypothetical protein
LIRLLPSFVCAADELALEFDHWRDVLIENCGSELTAEQIASLAAIDGLFSRFSRGGKYWLVSAGLLQYRPAMRMNM